MVFKGNIEFITEEEIGIRLRATQQNSSVLPPDSLYAIEHDTMDTTFRACTRHYRLSLRQPKNGVIFYWHNECPNSSTDLTNRF